MSDIKYDGVVKRPEAAILRQPRLVFWLRGYLLHSLYEYVPEQSPGTGNKGIGFCIAPILRQYRKKKKI
jgi:hypothetical protein